MLVHFLLTGCSISLLGKSNESIAWWWHSILDLLLWDFAKYASIGCFPISSDWLLSITFYWIINTYRSNVWWAIPCLHILSWYKVVSKSHWLLIWLVLIWSAAHLPDVFRLHVLRSYLDHSLMFSHSFSVMDHSLLNSLVSYSTVPIS